MLIKINFETSYLSKSTAKYVEYIKSYFVTFKIIIYGFLNQSQTNVFKTEFVKILLDFNK